jgi:hypothetical protein
MTRLAVGLCVFASVVACDHAPPIGPSPSPAVEIITVGQQVNRTFTGLALNFELVATKSGFLVTTLTWDGTENGTVLLLSVNDTQFRLRTQGVSRHMSSAGSKLSRVKQFDLRCVVGVRT